jgi:hypothetical protein
MEIGEGGEASRALEAMVLRPETMKRGERGRLRRALLAYCGQDTRATMGVLGRMRELVRAPRAEGMRGASRGGASTARRCAS